MPKNLERKKTFEQPTMEMLHFRVDDIITTSPLDVEAIGGGEEYDWNDLLPPSAE